MKDLCVQQYFDVGQGVERTSAIGATSARIVRRETRRILERFEQSVLIQSEDAKEGIVAFREKRPPGFRSY